MNINLKLSESCNKVEIFTIEGLEADVTDFGRMITVGEVAQYHCPRSYFKRNIGDGRIMDYYCLDIDDWNEICTILEQEVQFDPCSECV